MNDEELAFHAKLNEAFRNQMPLRRELTFDKNLCFQLMTELVIRSSSDERFSSEFEFLSKIVQGYSLVVCQENTVELRKSADNCLVFAKPGSSPSSFFSIKHPRNGQKPNTPRGAVETPYQPGLHLVVDYHTEAVNMPITWESEDSTSSQSGRPQRDYKFAENLEYEILHQLYNKNAVFGKCDFFPHAPSLSGQWRDSILNRVRQFPSDITTLDGSVVDASTQKHGYVREYVTVFSLRVLRPNFD